MLTWLTDWLSGSYLNAVFSDTTHTATWLIIPVSQSMHILAVAVVMMSVALINFRLLGVAGTRQSAARLIEQTTPWIWPALVLLLLTGTIQTIAEPRRELLSTMFWLKISMLLIAVGITVVYRTRLQQSSTYWEDSRKRRNTVRLLAVVSLLLWVGIVAAGRLIAYL
jgi:hypothetical protein